MPPILLPHFICPPSLPYPAALNTLLSHFSGFLHSHPLLVLPPSFTASLLPSLFLAQYSKSLPIATKGKTTTQHSSLRRPEHGIPSEKTQKPGKEGKANSETRKKAEESMDISRGRDELVSQGNLVGFETNRETRSQIQPKYRKASSAFWGSSWVRKPSTQRESPSIQLCKGQR